MAWDDDDDLTSVLVPVTITAAMVQSITTNGVALPEDTTSAWSSGATYAIGDRRHSATTHRVYESLKDGNLNHDPTDITNQFNASGTPTWWVDIGPTNRWAYTDSLISTQTTGASPLVITLRPGAFNGFAMYGLDGDTISVVVRDAPAGNVTYTTGGDVPLEGSMPADYYDYFFAPFKPLTEFLSTGIDPYGASEIVITLKKASGQPKIGMLAIGDAKPIGVPERGVRVSPRSYSYFEEDKFSGGMKITKRPSAMGVTIPVRVEYENADDVLQTVQSLLDVPVAVIGSNAEFHNKLSTFGLISGDMDYSSFPDRILNLTVKGFA
jgi:hypothetical protein